MLNTVTAKK